MQSLIYYSAANSLSCFRSCFPFMFFIVEHIHVIFLIRAFWWFRTWNMLQRLQNGPYQMKNISVERMKGVQNIYKGFLQEKSGLKNFYKFAQYYKKYSTEVVKVFCKLSVQSRILGSATVRKLKTTRYISLKNTSRRAFLVVSISSSGTFLA